MGWEVGLGVRTVFFASSLHTIFFPDFLGFIRSSSCRAVSLTGSILVHSVFCSCLVE